MPTIDFKDLDKYVNRLAKQAMSKGSATKNAVINEGKKQVDQTVYTYTPNQYDRTGKLRESWEVESTADGIAVFNTRKDEETGKDIVDTVEYGRNYDYTGYGYDYEKPRPFIQNTKKVLNGSSKLTNALKQDLKSLGADIE
ncbi:hypothetical protein [Cytobacillus gottheilii]|uniref:hypothetical protein n=1 Tax=Cytobacillus gottheilii TaxID=859144 RepID=UPI0009BB4238|nr:hypothetical protein [Cytobacillus gottheilii]